MADDFIRRSEAMNKINDIAAEFLKDHTIQCDIAAGVAVDIKNDVIKTLPAANVVEVVHGEWAENIIYPNVNRTFRAFGFNEVETMLYYTCSLCDTLGSNSFNYCPKCGAKMDGERRSENENT